jgi:hypothetical protein
MYHADGESRNQALRFSAQSVVRPMLGIGIVWSVSCGLRQEYNNETLQRKLTTHQQSLLQELEPRFRRRLYMSL